MSTSTESAWGPRDWSSHGGGGSWPEPPADRAPTPGSVHDTAHDTAHDSGHGDAVPEAAAGVDEGGFDDAPSRRGASDRRRSSQRRVRRASEDTGDEAPRERPPSDPAARARDICLRLLTGSARTRRQLADTLRRKEIPDEVAEQVLDRLTEVGLIDDAAYARSWVEQRQRNRGLARRALAGELRAKGVDSALVAEAVAEVDPDDEEAAARRLVERKLASTRSLDRQVRLRRLAGMLARRGYPEGLALRVVRAALDAEAADGFEDGFEDEDAFLDSGED
ncbi:regulatory protein RecX [Streptacidiphilus neutrinimicus]|uniref:regulatory protein RecX n=1 Tax=Streptacidiphilus neutrinimicus TaxID=105420 RepID=UPI000AE28360|nr:regulatory protein RecX [Streptacidiphilus neutrinimicus]